MDSQSPEPRPPEIELALAHTPQFFRARLGAYFALDQRLARIVSATTEPMLGQMRLAWWRDMLGADSSVRPSGDLVLDAIGEHWVGSEEALVDLVDGWEILIAEDNITIAEVSEFAAKRASPLISFIADIHRDEAARIKVAGMRWAMADAASKVSDESEREQLIQLGLAQEAGSGKMSPALRGLAVLEALSLRALKLGGRPLMEGRGAAITAMRAAIFGR